MSATKQIIGLLMLVPAGLLTMAVLGWLMVQIFLFVPFVGFYIVDIILFFVGIALLAND